MHSSPNQPYYLLDAKSSIIETHRQAIEATVTSETRRFGFRVAPEIVTMKIATAPQEIVLALQHHPLHIEKMLGTLDFYFQLKEGLDVFLPEEEWKLKAPYMHWFREMGRLELMPFFALDKDVRLYMIAGDYLLGNNTGINKVAIDGGSFKYEVRGMARSGVGKRLFACCKVFMIYCHGTGFDPKPAIEAMLADYTLPVHYIDIKEQYLREIKNYRDVWKMNGPMYRFRAA